MGILDLVKGLFAKSDKTRTKGQGAKPATGKAGAKTAATKTKRDEVKRARQAARVTRQKSR